MITTCVVYKYKCFFGFYSLNLLIFHLYENACQRYNTFIYTIIYTVILNSNLYKTQYCREHLLLLLFFFLLDNIIFCSVILIAACCTSYIEFQCAVQRK